MHHDLKIDEPYYQAVREGRKNFEIRFNDRGYQAGDTVRLFVHGTTLHSLWAKIGYLLRAVVLRYHDADCVQMHAPIYSHNAASMRLAFSSLSRAALYRSADSAP